MTPRRMPVARTVRRSVRLGAVIAAAVVAWLALSPLLAVPSGSGGPPAGSPAGSVAAVASPGGSPAASSAPSVVAGSAAPTAPTAPTAAPTVRPTATAAITTPTPAASIPDAEPSAGSSFPAPSAQPPASLPPVARRVGRPSATPLMKASLDRQLDRLRARLGIPGASAAVLFADGTVWIGTSGLADVAAKRAVTPDTPFSVGSVSKTFTAALILALAEDGRVGLDTPVRTYLPDLKVDRRITVRQLLDHTSGLNDFFSHPKVDAALLAEPGRTWLGGDSLAYVRKPYFVPGAGYRYSNTNYLILGMLAEAVGGAPIADQLRTRFLAPLGMTGTTYQGPETATEPAHGYRFTGSATSLPPIDLTDGLPVVPYTSVVTASGGAGSIASTAGDLVRWARALYGGSLLGERSARTMISDIERTAPYKPSVAYGLGVQSVVIDGRQTLGHSGRLQGARAVVRWLPTEGIAIAVLTNQSRADPRTIARALLRVAVVQPADCTACPGGW